nr:glycosyltransferase family 2 protein [uncultured Blautia sp.]
MKISVIIPVYESEQYLEKAVDSVLSQSLKDIEVILVDDCGKDRSGEICDLIAQKDSRVKVIHAKQNGGICKARNMGIKAAEGEYIAFCDDDDIYLPGLLEDNYILASKYNADMVKFGRKLIDVTKDGSIVREKDTNGKKEIVVDQKSKYDQYYAIREKRYLTNLWNGIYRKELIDQYDFRFDESMKFGSEDMDFSVRFYDAANAIAVNPKTYYVHYRRDASSTSRKFNPNKIESLLTTAKHESVIWDKRKKRVPEQVQKNQMVAEYVRTIITLQLNHKDCPYTSKEKIEWIKKISKSAYLKTDFNKKVKSELFKCDKKSWVTMKLLNAKAYRTLLFIMSVHQILLGEKWN